MGLDSFKGIGKDRVLRDKDDTRHGDAGPVFECLQAICKAVGVGVHGDVRREWVIAKGITSEGREKTQQGGDAIGPLYVLGDVTDELDELEGGGLIAIVEVDKLMGNEFRSTMEPWWMY
ncbi:hypothetical protein EDB86DRAFT_2829798 [Lactarius hatsudake]|nr:hypothetical protein EDB86DRAFT_2829798 [Lactarius hatsudake]